LRRLRAIFGDPLLVRSANRLAPTERGLELKEWLRRILDDIDAQLLPRARFEPQDAKHHFRLISANCFGATFLPRIISQIRQAAPASTVDIRPMLRFGSVVPLMAEGAADLIMGNWPQPPEQLRMSPLFSSDILCLVHGRHPFSSLRRLTLEQYLEGDHLSLTPTENAALSPIDARLSALGLHRRVSVSVPEYSSVPYVLAQTDLVFTTSRHFAEHLACLMPLSVIEAPSDFGAIVFNMLWHERSHRSPAHRWLRRLVRDVATSHAAMARPPLRAECSVRGS
jgi:DNA-binding transcriptional LysR family regulator